MFSLAMTTVMFTSCSDDESTANNSGKIRGYGYVDMGLSVKWAIHNVGSNYPLELGDYFAWGEVAPKYNYYYENSETYDVAFGDIKGKAQYDAALLNWGGTWRMPTRAEFEELINNCVVKREKINDVDVYKFTSNINGNSIFFPCGGYKEDLIVKDVNAGFYWSSTPGNWYNNDACCMLNSHIDSRPRYCGLQIRPVSK